VCCSQSPCGGVARAHAQVSQYNLILIVGDIETAGNTVAVRFRDAATAAAACGVLQLQLPATDDAVVTLSVGDTVELCKRLTAAYK
jgi:hypothetical protein